MFLKYLIPFLLSFFLSVIFTPLAVYFLKRFKGRGRDSSRHIHKKEIPRIGGVVMVIVFIFMVFANKDLYITSEIYGIMIASVFLMIVGLWDDVREIYWKIQLFFQVAFSILIFIFGIRIYFITNPVTGGIINLDTGLGVLVSIILVIFWMLLIVNSINWLDGIDGLSGGVTFISVMTIFFLSLKNEVNQPPVAILASIIAGSVLGFLILNFYPARAMAGTSGSFFMGFALAVLAIIAGTKIATALLVLAVPIIDFLWVIGERIKNNKSIFRADKRHLHYKLLQLGWSEKKISLCYWSVTALISLVALNTRAIGKGITLIVAVAIMLVVLIIIKRKTSGNNNFNLAGKQ
jgi:UDP-GlcNAc:undecaprenyl-phosphate/decaprenyl-phosphate GlcNAc-1-phosphate transferase